jgi:hypothetical protein
MKAAKVNSFLIQHPRKAGTVSVVMENEHYAAILDALDCRTCKHYAWQKDACTNDAHCVDADQHERAWKRMAWLKINTRGGA